MLTEIINKLLMIAFFMSCFTTIRHGYFLVQTIITSTEEEPKKYKISNTSLIVLCVCIAYIFTSIFTGIKL